MKKKELLEIKNKTIENLRLLLAEREKLHVSETLEQKLGKVKNVHSTGQLRKDIAKIQTIIAEKMFAQKVKGKTVGLPLKVKNATN